MSYAHLRIFPFSSTTFSSDTSLPSFLPFSSSLLNLPRTAPHFLSPGSINSLSCSPCSPRKTFLLCFPREHPPNSTTDGYNKLQQGRQLLRPWDRNKPTAPNRREGGVTAYASAQPGGAPSFPAAEADHPPQTKAEARRDLFPRRPSAPVQEPDPGPEARSRAAVLLPNLPVGPRVRARCLPVWSRVGSHHCQPRDPAGIHKFLFDPRMNTCVQFIRGRTK